MHYLLYIRHIVRYIVLTNVFLNNNSTITTTTTTNKKKKITTLCQKYVDSYRWYRYSRRSDIRGGVVWAESDGGKHQIAML